MEPAFSLDYYDHIFGERGEEFWELVQAVRDELERYPEELARAAGSRDLQALSRLRHAHRPMMINLSLEDLRTLETNVDGAIRTGAPSEQLSLLVEEFEHRARTVVQDLDGLIPGP